MELKLRVEFRQVWTRLLQQTSNDYRQNFSISSTARKDLTRERCEANPKSFPKIMKS
jgi:hypothetical protein